MEKAKYPINLPPKAAIEYFQQKKDAPSWNWHDTWQDAHVRAFVVAKVTKLETLQTIRQSVEKALKDGITFHQFQKELQPELEDAKWWGKQTIQGKEVQLGSTSRLKTIYQTNLKVAYSVGRYKAMIDNAESRPYWQYRTREDARVRDDHAALNRKVFRHDDPFWNYFYPPNGWNCRCYVVAMKQGDLDKEGIIKESSDGNMYLRDMPISKKSEIEKPVAVYRNPETGEETAITPGWSYNPGEAMWKPDLEKYPNELRIWFNQDGTYSLHPDEVKKINDHIENIRNTFKEWNGWESTAEVNYNPTDETFWGISDEIKDRDIKGIYSYQKDKIYIKTNTTLDVIGLASEQNQRDSSLTFTHEFTHSLRNYRVEDMALNDSKEEKDRVRKVEEGLTEVITRLWGVNYGGIKPEDLVFTFRQKEASDLILYTIKKAKERGVGGENLKEEVLSELYRIRTADITEVKEWAKDIRPIEKEEYKDFLLLAKNYGIIIKSRTLKDLTEGVLSWLLIEKN
jgi:SPP1 gp7 family putative phage head morphogenesis protein